MSGLESTAAQRSSSNNSNESNATSASTEEKIQDFRNKLTTLLTVNAKGHGELDAESNATASPTAFYTGDDGLSRTASPGADQNQDNTQRGTLSINIPSPTDYYVNMVQYSQPPSSNPTKHLASPQDDSTRNLQLTPPHQKQTMEEKWGSQNRYHATTLQRSKGGRQLPDLSLPNSQSSSGRSSPGR